MEKRGMVVVMKIKQFTRSWWSYILVALVALMIGVSYGPSPSEMRTYKNEIHELQEEIETLNKEFELIVKTLEESNSMSAKKIKELEVKVIEAEAE